VAGNSQNAAVFRDSQGTTLVLALVRLDLSRPHALGLMQQLILVRLKIFLRFFKAKFSSWFYLLFVDNKSVANWKTIEILFIFQAAGNEEDMTSLLELLVLRTAPSRDWVARTEILHSVIACLKESHRARTIFR
jgi:hypothetical protein